MARLILPVAGAVVGGIVGGAVGAQAGWLLGSLVSSAVDPTVTQGPQIGDTQAQTSQEGTPISVVYGTMRTTGNVIASGPLITGEQVVSSGKGGAKQENEIAIRTYAIGICEGPIKQVLRIWEDEKVVYDIRPNAGGLLGYYQDLMNKQWIFGSGIYYGTEDQLPDGFLQLNVDPDMPAFRGLAYMVFVGRDLTARAGSIPQYAFEVAMDAERSGPQTMIVGPSTPLGTYLDVSNSEPFLLTGQTNGTGTFEVGNPGQFEADYYSSGFGNQVPINTLVYVNSGSAPGDSRLWPIAVDPDGYGVSFDGNYGYCKLTIGGATIGTVAPNSGAIGTNWWYNESGWFPEYGGLVWYSGNYLYLGVRKTGGSGGVAWDRIMKFGRGSPGLPLATAFNITGSPTNPIFWMHVDQNGICRSIANNGTGQYVEYDSSLSVVNTVNLPSAIAARFPSSSAINGFGVDLVLDLAVYIYGGTTCLVYRPSSGALLATYSLTGAGTGVTTRVIINNDGIYIQRTQRTYFIAVPNTYVGDSAALSDIIADIHQRAGFIASDYDVSELESTQIDGAVLANLYLAGDAIDMFRQGYLFDKAEFGLQAHYRMRGKPVVTTLTIDDLVDTPDSSQRNQSIEYPKYFNLYFQYAPSGYATPKATSQRSSNNALVVGTSQVTMPIAINDVDVAAQMCQKLHKVAWADADGSVDFSVPMEIGLPLVPGDCIGLVLRENQTWRLRIDKIQFADGVFQLSCFHDRQSAYTSQVTGIPIPDPTPPPSTIVGDTDLFVLDIPSLTDSDDDMNLYYAVSGAMPAWYGATVQRSTDGGASWTSVVTITKAARTGRLVNALTQASRHYTDRTNTVVVSLTRAGQSIDSITNAQFRSEQGAFAIQNDDGTWEILQGRDVFEDSAGDFHISHLNRGRLDSTIGTKSAGAKFVMLDDVTHVPAQSSWIGQTITHRAPASGQSPTLAATQSLTYTGKSQIEWPPASLKLARDASNIVTGTWFARGRFGTDDAPVNSANMTGWRITIVGSSTVTFDQALNGTGFGQQSFTYDASALGASVTVSVQGLNRFTGPSTAATGTI